jgi:hypothetical protein
MVFLRVAASQNPMQSPTFSRKWQILFPALPMVPRVVGFVERLCGAPDNLLAEHPWRGFTVIFAVAVEKLKDG